MLKRPAEILAQLVAINQAKLTGLEKNVAILMGDVKELKRDIRELRGDVRTILEVVDGIARQQTDFQTERAATDHRFADT